MPRAIWKGAISFSLINIPVSLHAARRPATLDLDLLDKRDHSPGGNASGTRARRIARRA